MTTDLTALWHTNRRWRAWMDSNTNFKTPDTLDCLRYSLCESAEALDCWLRQKNPTHARNNGRDHTVESELADTAMLLLTALPVEYIDSERLIPGDLDTICHLIVNAIYWHKNPARGEVAHWCVSASIAVGYIAAYPGLDLPAELDRCWRRLALKHGNAALIDWWQKCGYEPTFENHELLLVPWLVEES